MVGCSRIYQVSLQRSEACLQGMAPLMIFCQFSNIRLLYSLWKVNIVMFKEFFQLVNGIIHALTLWMKASNIVGTSSLLKFLLFLETRGSIERSMILLWIRISVFGILPVCLSSCLHIF